MKLERWLLVLGDLALAGGLVASLDLAAAAIAAPAVIVIQRGMHRRANVLGGRARIVACWLFISAVWDEVAIFTALLLTLNMASPGFIETLGHHTALAHLVSQVAIGLLICRLTLVVVSRVARRLESMGVL